MKNLVLFAMIITGFSCYTEPADSLISPIDQDYSNIEDPVQRWAAYNLTDYSIDESWSCECIPPYSCRIIVKNNIVDDVKYEIEEKYYYGRTKEEIYNSMKSGAKTIDQMFALIEQYRPTAYRTDIVYHPMYGYPTKIFIDIDSLMVDEEIIIRFSNLQQL